MRASGGSHRTEPVCSCMLSVVGLPVEWPVCGGHHRLPGIHSSGRCCPGAGVAGPLDRGCCCPSASVLGVPWCSQDSSGTWSLVSGLPGALPPPVRVTQLPTLAPVPGLLLPPLPLLLDLGPGLCPSTDARTPSSPPSPIRPLVSTKCLLAQAPAGLQGQRVWPEQGRAVGTRCRHKCKPHGMSPIFLVATLKK